METELPSMTVEQAAESIALSKLAAKTGARELLTPGVYNVSTLVKVEGTIKVGEDYEATPTVSIPIKETMALFIKYCGCTRESAIKLLTQAMNEAMDANNGKAQGYLAETIPFIDETMKTVEAEILKKLTKQKRKGAVTSKLKMTKLVPQAV